MGLPIIFALVTILAAIGSFTSIKNKNILGIVFGLGTFVVIGWFTVMTFIHSGYPAAH